MQTDEQKRLFHFDSFQNVVNSHIDSIAKVSGGQPYLSNSTQEMIQKAFYNAKEFGDEYVSLESLLMGLADIKSSAKSILKDNQITKSTLKTLFMELRNGEKVNSKSKDSTYKSSISET